MKPIQNILVATDFTDIAEHACVYALDFARQLKANVHFLHVYETPVYGFPDGTIVATADMMSAITTAANECMDRLVKKSSDTGVTVEGLVRNGRPVDEIVRIANEIDADLIVVGTHGRHGFSRLLSGSIAEETLRSSPRPVLVIHGTHRA